jgi:hypothetical protein
MLPDLDRAERIGEFWSYPQSRTFAELLIDCEEAERLGRCSSACCDKGTERSGEMLAFEKQVRHRRLLVGWATDPGSGARSSTKFPEYKSRLLSLVMAHLPPAWASSQMEATSWTKEAIASRTSAA